MLPKSSLQPFAKAIAPLVLGIVGALLQWVITGQLDGAALATAITGIVAAALVYLVPERDRRAQAPDGRPDPARRRAAHLGRRRQAAPRAAATDQAVNGLLDALKPQVDWHPVGTGRAAAEEKRTRSGIILREADHGQFKGRDRNRPCPCGSGRKVKRCHGRG
jgi:hypothetical protein